jgi:hypothetical protein
MQILVAEYLHKRILFLHGSMELLGKISRLLCFFPSTAICHDDARQSRQDYFLILWYA